MEGANIYTGLCDEGKRLVGQNNENWNLLD